MSLGGCKWNNKSPITCPAGKNCCCQSAAGTTCTNCALCLCCYADNTTSSGKQCCCTTGSSCTFTEFNKTQISFSYWKNGGYSPQTNIYFNPIQVHIKLEYVKFDDLKATSSSDSSKSAAEYKPFIGTMVLDSPITNTKKWVTQLQ